MTRLLQPCKTIAPNLYMVLATLMRLCLLDAHNLLQLPIIHPLQANVFLPLYTPSTHKITNSICWLQPRFWRLQYELIGGSFPITTDNASCFNASQCSIDTGTADFLSYIFSEVTVLPESHAQDYMCAKGSVGGRNHIFGSLQ